MALPPGGFDKLTNLQIAEKNATAANAAFLAAGLSGDISAEAEPVLYVVKLKQAGTSTLTASEFQSLLKNLKLAE